MMNPSEQERHDAALRLVGELTIRVDELQRWLREKEQAIARVHNYVLNWEVEHPVGTHVLDALINHCEILRTKASQGQYVAKQRINAALGCLSKHTKHPNGIRISNATWKELHDILRPEREA